MGTCVRMTAEAHAHVRFRRALERHSLWAAEDAARDMQHLSPDDALQLVHLDAERGSPKFERAATRWLETLPRRSSPELSEVAKVVAGLLERREAPYRWEVSARSPQTRGRGLLSVTSFACHPRATTCARVTFLARLTRAAKPNSLCRPAALEGPYGFGHPCKSGCSGARGITRYARRALGRRESGKETARIALVCHALTR